jgi:heme/copper-type cytochrome/quinol oxidase subunit 2
MIKKKTLYYLIGVPITSLILWLIYYLFLFTPIEINLKGVPGVASGYYYSNKSEMYWAIIPIIIISYFTFVVFMMLIQFIITIFSPIEEKYVTLVKKHKEYYSMIYPKGSGASGYKYWFEFVDDDGNPCQYAGLQDVYVFMLEGARVKIKYKRDFIRSFEVDDY